MFKLYNTKTRKKQEFIPLEHGKARIYSCGPTVYNYFHIGNARPFIIFDTLRRYLKWRGYEVTFVQNFTDIDDKMINRANADGITVKELGERFIKEYYTDAGGLGILPPDFAPKATEHMEDIIQLVKALIDKGHAYEAIGDVYFDTQGFEGYGSLAGQNLEDLQLGARIDASENKKHPMDFALWKAQKPGEPAWDSPWGMGRPGWHIECSAMSMKYLGDTLDIHCGGQDLIFPHHQNETAQSEAVTGKPFANYWMHNGYININNQKMSKSTGNFFTVRDISKEFDLMAVRLFMLSAHYRSPVNFSRELIVQAKSAYERIKNCRAALMQHNGGEALPDELNRLLNTHKEAFIKAMDDDLNTADALGVVFELVRELNIYFAKDASGAKRALGSLDELLGVLGLVPKEADIPKEISDIADNRLLARKQKNWAESDRLRNELSQKGYVIEDTPSGYKLKVTSKND